MPLDWTTGIFTHYSMESTQMPRFNGAKMKNAIGRLHVNRAVAFRVYPSTQYWGEAGLCTRRSIPGVILTAEHRQRWRHWCRVNRVWTQLQWVHV